LHISVHLAPFKTANDRTYTPVALTQSISNSQHPHHSETLISFFPLRLLYSVFVTQK